MSDQHDSSAPDDPTLSSATQAGVDRRNFLTKAGIGVAATGAAWASSNVVTTFTSPAWAAGTALGSWTSYNSTVTSVAIAAGRQVKYDISGAGGGG